METISPQIPYSFIISKAQQSGPRPKCNCGQCRVCKQRLYRWRYNKRHGLIQGNLGDMPYIEGGRGAYRVTQRSTYHRSPEMETYKVPISESCETLDKDFPWLKGVDFH